jgi:SIR2-like domain
VSKRKLLVILGSGSSSLSAAGASDWTLPSVASIDREMKAWADELVTGSSRVYRPGAIVHRLCAGKPNYFKITWENRERYFAPFAGARATADLTQVNYERVLGDMHALMNGFIGDLNTPFGDPTLQGFAESVKSGLPSGTHDFHEILYQIKFLCIRLAKHFREKSLAFEAISATHAPFQRYCALLDGLDADFELGIYNLNYDTVAMNARPRAFTGFDSRTNPSRFNARAVQERPNWDFIYHLHGSVHHSAEPLVLRPAWRRASPAEIVWETDLARCDYDRNDLRTSTDYRRLVPTALVAGGWKLDQIQDEPFLTFYSVLPKHAHEADAILIGGYGFGDAHVNNVLASVMTNPNSRRPPVVVLGHTSIPTAMAQTLAGAGTTWLDEKTHAGFKSSTNVLGNRVLFWQGGFENAAPELRSIVTWLSSALAMSTGN